MPPIKTFLMPPGGGYMGEIEFWLKPEQGYKLAGSPSKTPGGAMMWTLAKPEVLLT
jgi:hypothetical protein